MGGESGEAPSRRAQTLLALGAAVGLAAAGAGLLAPGSGHGGLPPGAVASVNGEAIAAESWARAVAALASDRRDPLDAEDERRVLDRLIEEELLVQRGLELGLARHDRRVRGDLVSAVIDGVVAEAEGAEADAADLAAFHAENRDWFTRPGRLRVDHLWVALGGRSEDEVRGRAAEAVRRLRAGDDFAAVAEALGSPAVAPVPAALLPATKLREYLGPSALRSAFELAPGEVGDPVRGAGGFHVLVLREREEGRLPPLDEIRDVVAAEWRRRAGERALRSYLERLRAEAEVRVAEPLP